MAKEVIDEGRFIELCNEALQGHPEYVPGMRVEAAPRGQSGSGVGGYRLEPDDNPRLLKEVSDSVKAKYELRLTQG